MNDPQTHGIALLVLAAIAYIGVPWMAVRSEHSDRTVGPLPFILWFLAGYVGPPVAAVYLGPLLGPPLVAWFVALAVASVTVFVAFRHMVWRARDAGYPKALPMLAVVPLITIACAVFLTTAPRVVRGKGGDDGAPD
jgi:hypothetical protein